MPEVKQKTKQKEIESELYVHSRRKMGSEICQDRLVRHMKTDEWVSLGTQETGHLIERGRGVGGTIWFPPPEGGVQTIYALPHTPKCRPHNSKLLNLKKFLNKSGRF